LLCRKKVPYYIFSQIFGAFIAGLLLMGMYHQQLSAYAETTKAAGMGTVFNGGPASVLCSFPNENQTLGYLFLIEWFVDSYIVSLAHPTSIEGAMH
jgi:glycerol uptake facilitator-like aquaporin